MELGSLLARPNLSQDNKDGFYKSGIGVWVGLFLA